MIEMLINALNENGFKYYTTQKEIYKQAIYTIITSLETISGKQVIINEDTHLFELSK